MRGRSAVSSNYDLDGKAGGNEPPNEDLEEDWMRRAETPTQEVESTVFEPRSGPIAKDDTTSHEEEVQKPSGLAVVWRQLLSIGRVHSSRGGEDNVVLTALIHEASSPLLLQSGPEEEPSSRTSDWWHRDIKPENILVFSDESSRMGTPKLGDMGRAKQHQFTTVSPHSSHDIPLPIQGRIATAVIVLILNSVTFWSHVDSFLAVTKVLLILGLLLIGDLFQWFEHVCERRREGVRTWANLHTRFTRRRRQACYPPDGNFSKDFAYNPISIDNPFSRYCTAAEVDTYRSTGLCYFPLAPLGHDDYIYRSSCTDPTWKKEHCAN
ncbi:hypothetical protein EJ08DRAFT_498456 [Tothia fuscella]|uniref:Protein kinase domain-containing protein n=1 Tax=Tothia fuscella TaxID=1048955 RepID=A0A9P4U275_9PEZI|nr:hypothetical protein EJ08DRAFT_498456 [Tothia fuscella]